MWPIVRREMSAISRNLFDVTEKFSGVCPILGKNNISSAERFYSLHWLPIHLCINFKLHALLTYKTLTLCQTYYLPSLLSPYFTGRSLRSSDQNCFINVESAQWPARALSSHLRLKYGILYLHLYAPRLLSMHTFKHQLETHFFLISFSVDHSPSVLAVARVSDSI